MDNRFLRPLMIVEFLIAIEAIFTVWSEVGGQYHLDLMFWPWKLGIGFASAALVVAITANLVRNDGRITRRALLFCSFLITIFVLAGVVTYYYHLNEPTQQDEDQDETPAKISRATTKAPVTRSPAVHVLLLPGSACLSVTHHRQPLLAAKCLLELGHVGDGSIHTVARDGMRVGLDLHAFGFGSLVFTPDLAETQEKLLLFIESAELG
jgi:hypothetical protein